MRILEILNSHREINYLANGIRFCDCGERLSEGESKADHQERIFLGTLSMMGLDIISGVIRCVHCNHLGGHAAGCRNA